MAEREIIILGGGESGVGAALLARQMELPVFLSDRGSLAPAYRRELTEAGIPFEEGQHSETRILAAREVIKSPGIPDTVPLVVRLRAAGVPVIGEIEFAARYTRAELIAITGSNGKTTAAMLTYHLLRAAGLAARLGGNVGHSFARLLTEPPAPRYVLELSSFQLDSIREFRPHVAAVLNITPDHLDRYQYELQRYADSKLRITKNQREDDLFLYWEEDPVLAAARKRNATAARTEAISERMIAGSRVTVGGTTYELASGRLRGKHNALNAAFALRIARECGADPADLQRGLDSFEPAPHRLESVGTIDGVEFINDSKATNVDAVFYALDAMERPIVWIAGGTDKGNDYDPLLALAKAKVRALVCLGVDNEKLRAAFAEQLPTVVETRNMETAIQQARQLAQPGDVVLLSPACASFDLFKNYIDRGDQFRTQVLNLLSQIKNPKS
jgi:UDP-N-acetylmuramoylalanine--D-glutamate ligase